MLFLHWRWWFRKNILILFATNFDSTLSGLPITAPVLDGSFPSNKLPTELSLMIFELLPGPKIKSWSCCRCSRAPKSGLMTELGSYLRVRSFDLSNRHIGSTGIKAELINLLENSHPSRSTPEINTSLEYTERYQSNEAASRFSHQDYSVPIICQATIYVSRIHSMARSPKASSQKNSNLHGPTSQIIGNPQYNQNMGQKSTLPLILGCSPEQ